MGPCELMDLIGHDVNYAVTRSVFDAFYGDPRFQPSFVQLELVQAGRLGRKSGRGFFDYREGASKAEPATADPQPRPWRIALNLGHPVGSALSQRMYASAAHPLQTLTAVTDGRIATIDDSTALFATDGRSATAMALAHGLRDVVVIDLMLDATTAKRTAIAVSAHCPDAARDAVIGMLQSAGFAVSVLADSPGLAVFRTVAMLANEAFDAVHQQVCTLDAVDIAMRGGVNYPIGPVEWAKRIAMSTASSVQTCWCTASKASLASMATVRNTARPGESASTDTAKPADCNMPITASRAASGQCADTAIAVRLAVVASSIRSMTTTSRRPWARAIAVALRPSVANKAVLSSMVAMRPSVTAVSVCKGWAAEAYMRCDSALPTGWPRFNAMRQGRGCGSAVAGSALLAPSR
eukprot:TRINITY_DN17262_c0_g1_i1.p1 TRINITY_DN17262_c0_g1~~TRINITY_DN17262_c0_g1_i1.p1  ORF type:complete len:458 (+),score=70.04 TRINITY_DN17262_c0_g1_i1:150-1376(+)